MTNSLNLFRNLLPDAIRSDFQELANDLAAEKIYAIALVTDSYLESLYLAVSTEQSLLKQTTEYIREINPDSENYKVILRWTPAEWLYDNNRLPNSKLRKVGELLRVKDKRTVEFEADFYGILSDALAGLDKECLSFEGRSRNDVTVFISISDDDKAESVENYSAKILNPTKVYERFLKRFD